MPRKVTEPKIVVASHNAGKVREIAALLAPFGVETASAADLDLPSPEETEETFEGNARIKAHAAARASGLPALSDDSGFAVDALGGDPGVRAADWAETPNGRDFTHAMTTVHDRLVERAAPTPWAARFVCVLCLAWPDGADEIFRGEIAGQAVWPPRGDNGFGYDPMFIPEDGARTFGEVSFDEKQRDNHRARAFRQLVAGCFAGRETQ